jgi:Holliday junction resolvase
MGAMQRNKGSRAENQFAAMLTDSLGFEIKRSLGQARDGGADIKLGPFQIQIKHAMRPQIKAWWQQTCQDAFKGNGAPVLAYKINRQGWRIRVRMQELIGNNEAWTYDHQYTEELDYAGFILRIRKLDLFQ